MYTNYSKQWTKLRALVLLKTKTKTKGLNLCRLNSVKKKTKTKTMAAKLDISSPGKFKVTGEQTNLNKAWEQYLKRFDYYVKAANITKDVQKRALLLDQKCKTYLKPLKIKVRHTTTQ